MEEKKKRVVTKPQSALQTNTRKQGRVMFELNGLIHKLTSQCYDVREQLTADERGAMVKMAAEVREIKVATLKRLSTEYLGIINEEVQQGKRCPHCNATGRNIEHVISAQGALTVQCKKCSSTWKVTKL